jgi:ABC-type transport system involved in multi-copper enzyme maturation permease subunit
MLVAVAVRASTSFGAERDRQTLDSLLTTPLANRTLLWGKWLGSILSVRQAWWCLGAVWLLGLMTGGVHLLSLVLLTAAWGAYAAFAAAVGLWFSLRSRTTLRATVWTLLTLLAVGTGQPFLWLGLRPLAQMLSGPHGLTSSMEWDLYGVTPPGALVYLTFAWGDWYSFAPSLQTSLGRVGLSWVGVCFYTLAAAGLWALTRARFGAITGRMPH